MPMPSSLKPHGWLLAAVCAALVASAACAEPPPTPPALVPVDPAAELGNLTPPTTWLRGDTVVYMQIRDTDRAVRFIIQHQAPQDVPHAVSYAVADHKGRAVLDDTIQPHHLADVQFAISRPETLGIRISGTEGFEPWYSLQVVDHYYVIDTSQRAHFFRKMPRHYFEVPRGTQSFRLSVATGDKQEARVQVWSPDGGRVLDELLSPEQGLARTVTIKVPAECAAEGIPLWSVQLTRPDKLSPGRTSDDYWLQLLDIPPYVSDRRATLLRPVPTAP